MQLFLRGLLLLFIGKIALNIDTEVGVLTAFITIPLGMYSMYEWLLPYSGHLKLNQGDQTNIKNAPTIVHPIIISEILDANINRYINQGTFDGASLMNQIDWNNLINFQVVHTCAAPLNPGEDIITDEIFYNIDHGLGHANPSHSDYHDNYYYDNGSFDHHHEFGGFDHHHSNNY